MTLRDDMTDGLLQRARAGDDAAFDRLVTHLRTRIFRWALVITGDSDDAEDVTQQVTLAMHRKLSDFKERARFTTWLYSIARNRSLDVLAHRSKHAANVSLDEMPDVSDDVDRQITRLHDDRAAAIVRAFFSELPARQRELIELIDTQGYTTPEAAELMGIEQETARVHLLRARRTIRAKMLESPPEMFT